MTAKWMGIGVVVAVLACWLAASCTSSAGGSSCFPETDGPSDASCAGFDLDLACPVGLTPAYVCTCTAVDAADQEDAGSGSPAQIWVCAMPGTDTGSGGSPGTGGMGTGGMGTGGTGSGDAGAD